MIFKKYIDISSLLYQLAKDLGDVFVLCDKFPYATNVPLLYPPKTENLRICNVFMG